MKVADSLHQASLLNGDPKCADALPCSTQTAHHIDRDEAGDSVDPRHMPRQMRQCLVTGEKLPKSRMVRFVRDQDGCVVVDLAGKLPGRGVWITAQREALEKAVTKNAFARGFKSRDVRLAQQYGGKGELFLTEIARLQWERVLNSLGLCRRSGELITGFDKVYEAVKSGSSMDLLIIANNVGQDGASKLGNLATRRGIEVFNAIDGEVLSQATGFDGIGYVFVSTVMTRKTRGQPSKNVCEEIARYRALCPPH